MPRTAAEKFQILVFEREQIARTFVNPRRDDSVGQRVGRSILCQRNFAVAGFQTGRGLRGLKSNRRGNYKIFYELDHGLVRAIGKTLAIFQRFRRTAAGSPPSSTSVEVLRV